MRGASNAADLPDRPQNHMPHGFRTNRGLNHNQKLRRLQATDCGQTGNYHHILFNLCCAGQKDIAD
jgi:hypothetical protein